MLDGSRPVGNSSSAPANARSRRLSTYGRFRLLYSAALCVARAPQLESLIGSYKQLLWAAGREIVRELTLSQETMARLEEQMVPTEQYVTDRSRTGAVPASSYPGRFGGRRMGYRCGIMQCRGPVEEGNAPHSDLPATSQTTPEDRILAGTVACLNVAWGCPLASGAR